MKWKDASHWSDKAERERWQAIVKGSRAFEAHVGARTATLCRPYTQAPWCLYFMPKYRYVILGKSFDKAKAKAERLIANHEGIIQMGTDTPQPSELSAVRKELLHERACVLDKVCPECGNVPLNISLDSRQDGAHPNTHFGKWHNVACVRCGYRADWVL